MCPLPATHAGPVHDSHRAGYHPLAESIETLNLNEQPGSTHPPIVQNLDTGGDPRHASTTEDGPFPYDELISSGQSGGSSINYRGLEHKTHEPHQDRLPNEHGQEHRGNMARLFPASGAAEVSKIIQYPSANDKPPWGTTAPEPLHEGVPDLPEGQEQMPLQLFSGYVSYEQLEVVVVGRRRDPAEGMHWVRMRGPGGYFGPVPSTSRLAKARTWRTMHHTSLVDFSASVTSLLKNQHVETTPAAPPSWTSHVCPSCCHSGPHTLASVP